jgi:hypothetical protein
MAEEQQQNSQGQEDFKLEDNAPINVKVRKSNQLTRLPILQQIANLIFSYRL